MSYARTIYIIGLIGVIAVGVLSRTISTGTILIDKYLGDALYAVMIYLILRIWRPEESMRDHGNWAMILVFAIELFQLTGIPQDMRDSGSLPLQLLSIALGTKFGWYDIAAYAIGIIVANAIDRRLSTADSG